MTRHDAPSIRTVPIGIDASGTRCETDSMGAIDVPADRYWGAQTQRSLIHFCIGGDRMPNEVYHAYGYVKKAAANVNADAGRLPRWKADVISHVCDEPHPPRRCGAADRGSGMGWAAQLDTAANRVEAAQPELYRLAAGGTAVGTGLNAPHNFDHEIAAEIARMTNKPFITAPNKFEALGGLDAVVATGATLRGVAVTLMKIANDIRWLASGPRAGIGELNLPANEPLSSIMPGKVNPTQSEAMVMVCIQVITDDNAVAFAGSQGNFQLNAMRPIVINNFLHSARILGDACEKFQNYCVDGVELNIAQINQYVDRSPMLVTALSPVIGYDKASSIAHEADRSGRTLREAALDSGAISAEDFDRIVNPANMVGPF